MRHTLFQEGSAPIGCCVFGLASPPNPPYRDRPDSKKLSDTVLFGGWKGKTTSTPEV